MRLITIDELAHLTRSELLELLQEIAILLAALPEGTAEQVNAVLNDELIRAVLARRSRLYGPVLKGPGL